MVKIVLGDVTAVDTELIVNAANSSLMGGGGVDGAIHRAAGPRLLEFCRGLGGCAVGECVVTPAFDLPHHGIVHTVGPVYGVERCAELLERCYVNCLEMAVTLGKKSIAFPCISTGVYGYPSDEAAEIAVNAVLTHCASLEVVLVAYDSRNFEALSGALLSV